MDYNRKYEIRFRSKPFSHSSIHFARHIGMPHAFAFAIASSWRWKWLCVITNNEKTKPFQRRLHFFFIFVDREHNTRIHLSFLRRPHRINNHFFCCSDSFEARCMETINIFLWMLQAHCVHFYLFFFFRAGERAGAGTMPHIFALFPVASAKQ